MDIFSGSGNLTIALSWIPEVAMKLSDIGRGERWNVLRHGHVFVSVVGDELNSSLEIRDNKKSSTHEFMVTMVPWL